MAIVTANLALNMSGGVFLSSNLGFDSGTLTEAGPTKITIVGSVRTAVYEGQFSYTPGSTTPSGGTLSTFTLLEASNVALRIESAPAQTLGDNYLVSGTSNANLINSVSVQIVSWLRGNDKVSGSNFDDILLTSGSGNDKLEGRGGNDNLSGGTGTDTAVYQSPRSSYTVSGSGSTRTVAGPTSEGTDEIRNIEHVQFSNGTLVLDLDVAASQVYRLYQAAFARTPDTGGLGYWIQRANDGLSLQDISRNFVAEAEFRTNFGTAPDPTSLVSKFYSNVLGRAGDTGGQAYWVGEINRGATPAEVLRQFAESPENTTNVNPRISSGIWLENYFFL